jgi:maltose alpha-D-glucosyltransferase/alpha-amylase
MWKLVLFIWIGLISGCQQQNPKETTPTTPPVPLPTDFVESLWYKNSLIYSVDVEVFQDSDNDGVGDFNGLRQQLGYLQNLGVETIWLAPFQPTPNLDDGYDTSDFYGVDPRLGTLRDFDAFMSEATTKNIRVIMDLVTNHTSDQHPWFKQARSSPTSPYRNWYVWSKKRPEKWNTGMVFPGVQTSIWSYDKQAGEYYYHRFYESQPDLNMQNPAVLQEMRKIVAFWLDKGIGGFRVDAVPFLIEVANPTFDPDKPEHQFDIIKQLHQFIQWHKRDAILLGEANVDPKEQEPYFGKDGTGMQTMFNFFANQHLFYALASAETARFKDALSQTKNIPYQAQWAFFLRNHDEIDLGRLSDEDREKVYARFGPDSTMQLYDRGIRRRLAPMLGDQRLVNLANSLLFSLPGMPVIRYGEEIGMGDDLSLNERLSVRTPMQWTAGENAGFTVSAKPVRPIIHKGKYSYTTVNVAAQRRDSASTLNMTRRFARLRKQNPEIGWGSWEILDPESANTLVIRYEWKNRSLLIAHNFSPKPQTVSVNTGMHKAVQLADLADKRTVNTTDNGSLTLQLPAYGYKWYRINVN